MYESIGRNIKKYRQQKKLRQEDLAERAGLSTNYVGMVERGEKIPSLETFITILNVLEVSADVVLADVLVTGYRIKDSLIAEKLAVLSKPERERVYAVVDALIAHK